MIPVHATRWSCLRTLWGTLFCLSIVTMLALPAAAQTSGAGTITGTVADASEAVIPGAIVTLTNTDTGIVHTYTTNSAGLYVVPFLQPGHYKVNAEAASFGKVEATNLTLLGGQTLTIAL